MATYDELFGLDSDSAFRNKIAVAVVVKAHAVLNEPSPSAGRVGWATAALANPAAGAKSLLRYVVAENKGLSVAQILSASDGAIQTNVNTAVDVLAGA